MKIAIGSDHRGIRLKKEIMNFLNQENIELEDFGTFSVQPVDYFDIAYEIAQKVVTGKFDRGIIVCRTGIGVNIVANKMKGVRAVLCNDVFSAQMSRAHNNTNILTLGEEVIGLGLAKMIVKIWVNTEFEGGRHINRLSKIVELEKL